MTTLRPILLWAALATAAAGCDARPSSARAQNQRGGGEAAAPVVLPDRIGVISDFETNQLRTPFGTDWRPIDDKGGGGISTAEAVIVPGGANGTGHALEVTGTVEIGDYLFPMAGIGLPLGPVVDHIPSPVDLTKYAGIQFWVKGDGKRYMLRVADDDVKDYNFHHFPFTTTGEWQLVKLAFVDLQQFDWGQRVAWTGRVVSSFLFTNYSPPGEDFGALELYVDEISLF
jgi:hypothetical protein